MDRLISEFGQVLDRFLERPAVRRLIEGEVSRAHYTSLLREQFHHGREHPKLQALAAVHFHGYQRTMSKAFYRHAVSELGHDQLALNDMVAMGEDTSKLPMENPLPATSALIAFTYYQINTKNPLGYLGYQFFLKFAPPTYGRDLAVSLRRSGVPENALSLLVSQSKLDQDQNQLMELYVINLLRTKGDFEAVVYAMKTTAELYAQMIGAAFEDTEHPFPRGWDFEEITRART